MLPSLISLIAPFQGCCFYVARTWSLSMVLLVSVYVTLLFFFTYCNFWYCNTNFLLELVIKTECSLKTKCLPVPWFHFEGECVIMFWSTKNFCIKFSKGRMLKDWGGFSTVQIASFENGLEMNNQSMVKFHSWVKKGNVWICVTLRMERMQTVDALIQPLSHVSTEVCGSVRHSVFLYLYL